jgi:hypothetical protein
VIAVISIGIIVTIVYKMTQSSEVIKKEVSFDIDIDYDEVLPVGTYYPLSIFNELSEYGVIDEYGMVTNIVSGYVNNDEINDINMEIGTSLITFYGYTDSDIYLDYDIHYDGYVFNAGDIEDDVNIKIVFDVPQPPQLTGNSAALILLIPLGFAGGVLLYFYKPFKKE